MPRSKLRQALGAVKDQTSLGLAKVSNNATLLDVAILKATTHDQSLIDDRHIKEIIQLVSSSQSHAAGCVQSLSRRIGRTRNWVVVLKSLVLVLKIFQHGDPYFPCEVFHAMKQGAKILNLSGFRDNKSSSPWDYTEFVRAFALYLDERLDCVLTGKLHKEKRKSRGGVHEPAVRDMKPAMLLDMILHWQKLIDKIIATTPTSVARNNKFLQICLYSIVQESFDLYKDISDALALLLDSFFQLQHQSCVTAFQTCVRASRQFEQLGAFYMVCRSIGVGRSSEYPSVQKISNELIETLQEFLKDKSSFPINNGSRAPSPQGDGALFLAPTPLSTRRTFSEEFSKTTNNSPDIETTVSRRHHSSSSIDNFDFCEVGLQKLEIPRRSDKQRSLSEEFSETTENSFENDSDVGTVSNRHPSSGSTINFDFFEMGPQISHVHEISVPRRSGFGSWELVLGESENVTTLVEATSDNFNPFLQDLTELTAADHSCFSVGPTNEATMAPTFSARNADEKDVMFGSTNDEWCMSQEKIVHEQQLWLEHQNKIISKNMT